MKAIVHTCFVFALVTCSLFSIGQTSRIAQPSDTIAGSVYDSASVSNASILLEEILAGRNDAAYLYGFALPGADLSDSTLLALEQAGLPAGFKSVALKNELGRIYLEKGNLTKADSLITVAIDENRSLSGSVKNPEIVMSYYYKSRLVERSGLLNEAIGWVNKALEEAHFGFRAGNLFDMPDDVLQSVSPQAFFRCLRQKASLLYKKSLSENQLAWLDRSVMAYVKAVELNRYILRNLDNTNARRFYIENSKALYDEAIPVVYEACTHHPKHLSVFLFMLESYKGSELAHALRNAQIRLRSNVPQTLLQQEKTTRQLLEKYYTRIHSSNLPSIVQLSSKHVSYLQQQLAGIRKSIDERLNTENLYAADIDRKGILKKMQRGLDGNTLLVHYYVCGNRVFLCYLTKNKAGAAQTTLTPSFYRVYNSFQTNINKLEDGNAFNDFASAKSLYDFLIKPIEKVTGAHKKWIIVPDDFLYNIPFDALCRKPGKEHSLVHYHTISYHYAFRLLLNKPGETTGTLKKDSVLAYAPFAFSLGTGLGIRPLPFSEEEVSFSGAQKVLRQKAIKSTFLQQYRDYKYLHLATHASFDNTTGDNWIMFYPNRPGTESHKLYMQDIYKLNLHGTWLVTLSACQTASGNMQTGEGPVSFSRGFLYAGAAGVVSTLYKTDDRVTAFIMQKMYGYLADGWGEAKALQQAKIDLLNDASIDPKLKHANYWANFIYTGMYRKEKGPFEKASLLLLLFLVPALWLAFRYFKKKFF